MGIGEGEGVCGVGRNRREGEGEGVGGVGGNRR